MASVWKTAGVGAAAGLAVPVAGLSGLAAAGLTLILVLAMIGVGPARLSQASLWGLLTSELMLYLLISLAIFTLSFRFLARLQARCQALVARINAQQGLSFDAGHLLGYPAPAFLVFDSQNRKIAACDVVNDAYKLHDFSWLLGWRMTWREVESMEMNGGSRQVNASGMSVPTFERTVRAKDFAIELQTADPQRPVLSFPMSRRAAETWCARLNAIFNG
ncbi:MULTISPECIES: hypothetical protein [Gammaproteobacteria]|uniref:Membrane protein n=2 Tax=Pseudomonadota TaxID=1224 RepID=A0A8D4C5K7_9GAMM|nr:MULTISPECIES: hypothetical protein [Gammaproteobacteria]AVZ78450.1 hypothetical protein C3497_02435 [Zoogloeaceae bacteirum Par-f-2]RCL63236.1 MAG: hypothetical protein DBW88_04275 [Pseudomonas sp.]AJE14423.1 membrane protein [Stutzerimonas balearica DSM 6083]ALZ21628.1 hypothetical protein HV97_23730 [Pseudomonas aeruginosa]KSN48576.1 hypothetical protein APA87_10805 [Pseudomonas aeruginosa]